MNHNEHLEKRDGPSYSEDSVTTVFRSCQSSHWRSPIYDQLAQERESESSGNENETP